MQFLRTQPHLRPRTQKIAAVMRIADAVDDILHAFLRSHSFVKVNTPTITTSDTEGAGEMFQVLAIYVKRDAIAQHYHVV